MIPLRNPYIIQLCLGILIGCLLSTAEKSTTLPTPPEIWTDFDPNAGDFEEEIISENTVEGIYHRDSYISVYVNNEKVRVYCKYSVKVLSLIHI